MWEAQPIRRFRYNLFQFFLPMSTSVSPTQPAGPQPAGSHSAKRNDALPPLFARPTRLLGWQGLSATMPDDWNLASYGGDHASGNLRVDDDDGARFELRWEQPSGSVDLSVSVARFVETLERQAKKNKQKFEAAKDPRLISRSRKRKTQLVCFGWTGERDAPAGQGWGVSWQCADCGRVIVAQIIGRGRERPERVRELATEVLSGLECHGSGGWETWSVFDLRLEVPEEFHLSRSRLLTGRLELEWTRTAPPKMLALFPKRPERLALTRLSLADSLLGRESLEEWACRTSDLRDKKLSFGAWTETVVRTHAALLGIGALRDWRKRLGGWLLARFLRQAPASVQMRLWHCEPSNKIFALTSDLSLSNAHVTNDVLESLECH